MNLKEALKRGKLKQFAKEHENKDPHPMGKERFRHRAQQIWNCNWIVAWMPACAGMTDHLNR
jgi:hypothetical protein